MDGDQAGRAIGTNHGQRDIGGGLIDEIGGRREIDGAGREVVIDNGQGRRETPQGGRGTRGLGRRITQDQEDGLIPFNQQVVDDGHQNGRDRLTIGKEDRAIGGAHIIQPGSGGPVTKRVRRVTRGIVHRHVPDQAAKPRHGDDGVAADDAFADTVGRIGKAKHTVIIQNRQRRVGHQAQETGIRQARGHIGGAEEVIGQDAVEVGDGIVGDTDGVRLRRFALQEEQRAGLRRVVPPRLRRTILREIINRQTIGQTTHATNSDKGGLSVFGDIEVIGGKLQLPRPGVFAAEQLRDVTARNPIHRREPTADGDKSVGDRFQRHGRHEIIGAGAEINARVQQARRT